MKILELFGRKQVTRKNGEAPSHNTPEVPNLLLNQGLINSFKETGVSSDNLEVSLVNFEFELVFLACRDHLEMGKEVVG